MGLRRRLKRNYPFKRIYMLSKIKRRKYVSVIANQSSVSRYLLIAYIYASSSFLDLRIYHTCATSNVLVISAILLIRLEIADISVLLK